MKCNIGISWIKKTRVAGMGWIVRNSEGVTVLHSRRAFSGVLSLLEAKRLGLVWAAESMLSHKIQRVRFEVEDWEVVGAVNRPKAWPAYRSHGGEIREIMSKIADWEVSAVRREVNKAAFLIARSVTNERRIKSYVAQGSPSWLRSLLAEETRRQ